MSKKGDPDGPHLEPEIDSPDMDWGRSKRTWDRYVENYFEGLENLGVYSQSTFGTSETPTYSQVVLLYTLNPDTDVMEPLTPNVGIWLTGYPSYYLPLPGTPDADRLARRKAKDKHWEWITSWDREALAAEHQARFDIAEAAWKTKEAARIERVRISREKKDKYKPRKRMSALDRERKWRWEHGGREEAERQAVWDEIEKYEMLWHDFECWMDSTWNSWKTFLIFCPNLRELDAAVDAGFGFNWYHAKFPRHARITFPEKTIYTGTITARAAYYAWYRHIDWWNKKGHHMNVSIYESPYIEGARIASSYGYTRPWYLANGGYLKEYEEGYWEY